LQSWRRWQRKAVLAEKLTGFDPASHANRVCGAAEWQHEPFRIRIHETGMDGVSFDLAPRSAVLVEDSAGEAETPTGEAN
jgi:hypothetical protein